MSSQLDDRFSISNLKRRTKEDTFVVFGYVRQSHVDAPPLVVYVCLAFYGCAEHFIQTNHAAVIIEDKMRIQHHPQHDDNVTCYGFIDIPSTDQIIHTWTFKINDIGRNSSRYGVNIGIDSGRKAVNSAFCYQRSSHNYGYYGQGQILYSDKPRGNKEGYDSNDIIKMQLDLKNQTLSYAKNDGALEVFFDKIVTEQWVSYCLAVHLRFARADVTLLEYSARR